MTANAQFIWKNPPAVELHQNAHNGAAATPPALNNLFTDPVCLLKFTLHTNLLFSPDLEKVSWNFYGEESAKSASVSLSQQSLQCLTLHICKQVALSQLQLAN